MDTECRSRLFVIKAGQFAPGLAPHPEEDSPNQTEDIKRTYELPLMDSFSVMSVTPREAFQISFTYKLTDILADTTPDDLNPNGKRKLRHSKGKRIKDNQVQLICSYDFYVQNPQVKNLFL